MPIIGNFLPVIYKGFVKNDAELLKKYGKTYGEFSGPTAIINTADVELIKLILVKDAHFFINRRVD